MYSECRECMDEGMVSIILCLSIVIIRWVHVMYDNFPLGMSLGFCSGMVYM